MDKKTIGQFIATLRKANGMTQKQLAEKLNVTDKAVSRWERDESYPDLTLIPVIAEIFQVTSDELLRGEKKNVASVENSPREAEKTERQIENMLGKVNLNFGINTIIAVGMAIAGLIVTMICSIGLDEVHIGFYAGCVFYLGAIICEIIFTMKAWYSMGNNECESASFAMTRKKIITKLEWSICLIAVLFAYSLPLVTVTWYANEGVNAVDWFGHGITFAIICAAIYVVVVCIVNMRTAKAIVREEEITRVKKVNRIRLMYTIVAIGIVVICVACMMTTNYLPTTTFTGGETFYSVEDFIEYMETPYSESGEALKPFETSDYYESICGRGYEVNNQYVWEISDIEYNDDGSFYSITVYTFDHIQDGYFIAEVITGIWILICIAALIVIGVKYRKKTKMI